MRSLALAAVALVLLAAGCGDDERGAGPPPGRFVATSRDITKAHLFGDPVHARVDVVVDPRRLDPDRIRLRVDFLPYRIIDGGIRRSRREFSRFTRLRYDLTLRCLTIQCVPSRLQSVLGGQEGRGERRTFTFKPARVVYDDPKTGRARHLRRVWWPPVDNISGLSATGTLATQTSGSFVSSSPGAEFETTLAPALEPSYRLPPAFLGSVLLAAAAALLVLPGTLIAREVRRRRPEPEGELELPPLERALRVVEWASEHGDAEERREALEALAFELDAKDEVARAQEVRTLAWSPEEPSAQRITEQIEAVRKPDAAAA